MKNQFLNKKRKKPMGKDYLTAEKCVKNYREKQKSHAAYKRKVYCFFIVKSTNRYITSDYDSTKENKPIIVVRISGAWERISKEIKAILIKLKLHRLYAAVILKYDEETYKIIKLIESYTTWGYLIFYK